MSERLAEYLVREYHRGGAGGGSTAGPHPDTNLWALLADGLISPGQRDELLAHAESCRECRQRIADTVREWDDELEIAGGRAAHSFEGYDDQAAAGRAGGATRAGVIRLLQQTRTYALAACLLIAIGVGLYLGLRQSSYGIDPTLLIAAEAPLTELGLDLGRGVARGGFEPAITEAEYRRLLGRLEPELAKPEPAVEALALATRLALSARFFHDAAGYGQRWVNGAPEDAAAHNAYGLALFHKNEFEAALAAFERAIELAPDRAAWRLNAALAADEADQIPRTRAHLRRLKEIAPDHPQMREIDRWLERLGP